MAQVLSLSRAARLAGVSRREIQTKIRSGELQTFEGGVQTTDLLRVFPEIDLDYDPTFEQIERIKAESRAKFPWQKSEPPSAELLLRRLQSLSSLLVQTKGAHDQNIKLLRTVADRLEEIGTESTLSPEARDQIGSLHRWLVENEDVRDLELDSAAKLFTKNMLLHIIAPSVQFIPSGHEFQIEGGDSILDGAIKSGNNVRYGCSDATCGACKARVISGQVIEIQTPSHELSDHEQQMGYMLMCCNTAVTDLMIEVAETAIPADLPGQVIETTVSGLDALNETTVLVRLKLPVSENFRYFAGQKAALTLAGGEAASVSMFSCPCDREYLHFVIPRRHGDAFSETVFAGLKPGEAVSVAGPEGGFVLRDGASNPAVFIACDGGFAPVKSLIEHAISIDRIEAFHLYRCASAETPDFYHNLCRSWEDAFDNFTYTPLEMGGGPDPVVARIIADIPDFSAFDVYLAAPPALTDALRDALIGHNLPADRLHIEVLAE